jgi:ATP-dependent helicase HepA
VRLNYLFSARPINNDLGHNFIKFLLWGNTYFTCEVRLGQGSVAEDVAKQMGSDFSIGQCVYLKADPNRQGPIVNVLPPVGGRYRYRVFHTPTEIREYYAEQLCSLMGTAQEGREARAIFDIFPLPADEFPARLIAARLSHPLTDNLYALHAARIKFIPFQFKPLLRLLRADRPRLLIADELGVGKTIAVGLILKELQARQRLGNVLIVCPKALVTRWRAEMRRFDEELQPLTAETLRYCLKETQYDGAWPVQYSRAIIHLELFRNQDCLFGTTGRSSRPGLATLDPPPQFSLAIFDEAHHLRNPKTSSNQLARFICDNASVAKYWRYAMTRL